MKLKNILTALIMGMIFCLKTHAQPVKPEAAVVLNNALKKAASEKKAVLLTFYAQWIPWSAQLEKALNEKECQNILQKYYQLPSVIIKSKNLSRIKNYENPGADVLYGKYFSKVDSLANKAAYPLTVFLDSKGTKINQYQGYPDRFEGIGDFTDMLKGTSAITASEIQIIKDKFNAVHQAASPAASTDQILKEAYKKAAAENKKVFVIFTASWCHWCHALQNAIEHPLCRKFFEDNFVVVPLIVKETEKRLMDENYGSDKLLQKYQGNRDGIPFWIIFDKNGKWITDYNGYPIPRDEQAYKVFEEILKNNAKVTPEDLVSIKEAFTEMGK